MKNAKLLGTAAALALSFSFASPALADPMTQMDLVTLKRLAAPTASPDGRWVALVVRHIYGPEDLVVIGRAELPSLGKDGNSGERTDPPPAS